LLGTYSGKTNKPECEEHLEELALLADTYGVNVVGIMAAVLRRIDAATFLTSGKLQEAVDEADEVGAELIIIDEAIAPSQQRNLEAAFKRKVMDREELIIGVFAQRAKTKEARLQIDLAKIRYEFPRLKRLWTHLSRQRGGGTSQKGEGEKQLELDKRMLQERIDRLQRELKEVRASRLTQRASRQRAEIPVFAIVGYTNAGKSTLINALTDAGVFVEDKLFATLDTTSRKFILPNQQQIILIDTVGFIRKLPHHLVEAFKATLEEVQEADILLHVVDSSHPNAAKQIRATQAVLEELHCQDKPVITILNKSDCLEEGAGSRHLRLLSPKCVTVSALKSTGFEELLETMVEELSKRRRTLKLRIPQSDYQVVSELMRVGKILYQDYEGNDVLMRVDIPIPLANRLAKYEE